MKPFQERVVEEKNELQKKLIALQEFICTNPAFEELGRDEKRRLREQTELMDEYHDILIDRIAAFESK